MTYYFVAVGLVLLLMGIMIAGAVILLPDTGEDTTTIIHGNKVDVYYVNFVVYCDKNLGIGGFVHAHHTKHAFGLDMSGEQYLEYCN